MADTRGILKNTDYSDGYYSEHVQAGLDFLVFGDWHVNYAATITEATLQASYPAPAILDAGCACGAQVKGFMAAMPSATVYGVDVSTAMIDLGRAHFDLPADRLIAASLTKIPLASESVTLINSGQVLEHLPHEIIPAVMREFWRILVPGGRMFHNLAALKHGDPIDLHDGDPTHVNVKPTLYWADAFTEAGFIPDFESYDRFARSPIAPGEGWPPFYQCYEIWTSMALQKPIAKPQRWPLSRLLRGKRR